MEDVPTPPPESARRPPRRVALLASPLGGAVPCVLWAVRLYHGRHFPGDPTALRHAGQALGYAAVCAGAGLLHAWLYPEAGAGRGRRPLDPWLGNLLRGAIVAAVMLLLVGLATCFYGFATFDLSGVGG